LSCFVLSCALFPPLLYRVKKRVVSQPMMLKLCFGADVQVFTLTASDYATAVAMARNGTSLSLQINSARSTGRHLLQSRDQDESMMHEHTADDKVPRRLLLQEKAGDIVAGNATQQQSTASSNQHTKLNSTGMPPAAVDNSIAVGNRLSSGDISTTNAEVGPQDTSPAVMSWLGTLEMAPLPAADPKVQQDLRARPRSTFGKMKRVKSFEQMQHIAKTNSKKRRHP
jgi:hypothetical protein